MIYPPHHDLNHSSSTNTVDLTLDSAWGQRRVVTLFDFMKRFQPEVFVVLSDALGSLSALQHLPATILGDAARQELLKGVEVIKPLLVSSGLPISVLQVERILTLLDSPPTHTRELQSETTELVNRVFDEMSSQIFLQVSAVGLYQGKDLFGQLVADKFPETAFDIEEAGRCFAVGRYTGCVFHLMRVMELGVQFLGKTLHVPLPTEKEWGTILNALNGKIKQMTSGSGKLTVRRKAKRDQYAAAVAHLTNVKDAWRNRVMHPKDKYLEEEAEEVFRFVKAYMAYLAREF